MTGLAIKLHRKEKEGEQETEEGKEKAGNEKGKELDFDSKVRIEGHFNQQSRLRLTKFYNSST